MRAFPFDPGPLPTSPAAMGGPESDEHEPYLEFLNWIFDGRSCAGRVRNFPHPTVRQLNQEQRVAWMRRNCPRTYALLAMGQRWPGLADL